MSEAKENNDDLEPISMVNDPQAHYGKSENDLLSEALARTHEERFYFATKLYKIQQTMSKATIIHKADNLKK